MSSIGAVAVSQNRCDSFIVDGSEMHTIINGVSVFLLIFEHINSCIFIMVHFFSTFSGCKAAGKGIEI
jgi:hypothetical protein